MALILGLFLQENLQEHLQAYSFYKMHFLCGLNRQVLSCFKIHYIL